MVRLMDFLIIYITHRMDVNLMANYIWKEQSVLLQYNVLYRPLNRC